MKEEGRTIFYAIAEKAEVRRKMKEKGIVVENETTGMEDGRMLQKPETKMARFLLRRVYERMMAETRGKGRRTSGLDEGGMPKIEVAKNGKPYFRDSKLKFNYAHSQRFVAVAICEEIELGVDIEEKRRKVSDRMAEKYLEGAKTNDERIERWTKKESYGKMVGLGMKMGFDKLELKDLLGVNFYTKETAEYYCAICYEGEEMATVRVEL